MAERTRGYAHRVDIKASAELVWRALTEPALMMVWCGPGARVTPRASGSYQVRLNSDLDREAHIDVWEPPRRLRLIYLAPRELPHSEAVVVDDFIIDAHQGLTVVRLLGSGFPEDQAWEAYGVRVRANWGLALARLKVCSEQLAAGREPVRAGATAPGRKA